MKKIIFAGIILVIISLTALLYTHNANFNFRNIEKIYLVDSGFEFDLSDEMVVQLIKKLDGLKQYKRSIRQDGDHTYQMVVVKKFGQDKTYQLDFDHDFSHLLISDLDTNTSYLMAGDLVEWLYMHDAFSAVYDYKTPQYHQLSINGKTYRTKNKMSWQYMKADELWYENGSEDPVLNRLVVGDTPIEFDISYDSRPNTSTLNVFKDDNLVFSGDINDGLYVPLENGQYLYKIESHWTGTLFRGRQVSEFEVECDYPPEFEVSSHELEQGHVIVITGKNIKSPEDLFVSQTYLEGIHFSQVASTYECVIPATYYTSTGFYTIEYGMGSYRETLDFEVVPRNYEIQYLYVDAETTASTQTTAAYEEYNQYYKTALLEDVYEPVESFLNRPAFILPTYGRLTTEFGEQRYVNDKKTSYNHGGLDIANDVGTPIVATADGQVVLSKNMMVTGNTIVISHGNGIFSSYFHMNALNVSDDQIVKQGDVIGEMGTTGFSTGSHLHFGISYYKMNLEPGYFIYGNNITYDQYKELLNTQ